MVKGDLVILSNRIQWTLQTTIGSYDITEVSESFEFQDRKCTLSFYYGYDITPPKAICLAIDFNRKEKFNQSLDVVVLISSTSKNFPHEKHSVSGEHKQVIWNSLDFGMRGYLLTFEMVFFNADSTVVKNDKFVQTPTYIDTRFSLERSSKDFAKLLDDDPNHDVEFACGDQTIKAHKSILCCRSDVFTSMLQSDMVEGKTGRVDIQDMDAAIFRQFLGCLYTGMLPELTIEMAVQLYIAGDKYAVDTVKLQCAEFLMDNLSLENACEILVLSDRHNDPDLKKSVMEYVFKEKIPVLGCQREKWINFCNENKNLALEVYDSFCQYICQK